MGQTAVTLNRDAITNAIIASGVSGEAAAEGARLIDGWLDKIAEFPEVEWEIIGTEVPFYVALGDKCYVIGVVDALFRDTEGHIVQAEWKTRRSPKRKGNGELYANEIGEDGWLEEISNSPQLGFYALAGSRGTFIFPDRTWEPRIEEPRIMVRAAIKSFPVEVWPKDGSKGIYQFFPAGIESVEAALKVKCRQIRAAKSSGLIPWQLVGNQCENKYRRVCSSRDGICKKHAFPAMRVGAAEEQSESRKLVYETLKLDPADPEITMLSQSGYESYSQCMELGRQRYECDGSEGEESYELQVGSVFHVAASNIYRQLGSILPDPNVK